MYRLLPTARCIPLFNSYHQAAELLITQIEIQDTIYAFPLNLNINKSGRNTNVSLLWLIALNQIPFMLMLGLV